jgi:hypothetical protein
MTQCLDITRKVSSPTSNVIYMTKVLAYDGAISRFKGLPSFRFTEREAQIELAQANVSVYRWWYEFLRLSEDYRYLCHVSRDGEPRTGDKRLVQVYKDFGDVFRLPFSAWWSRRGSKLFREKAAPAVVRAIDLQRPTLTASQDQWGSLLIEVPLSLTRMRIMREVGKLITDHQDVRPRSRLETSKSQYPINPVRFKLHTLQTIHEVHCLCRDLILNADRRTHSEEIDQFRIGKILHLNRKAERLIGEPADVARKKNTMRATVGRYLARGSLLIANVEIGAFPKYSPVVTAAKRFTQAQQEERLELIRIWRRRSLLSEISFDAVNNLVQRNGLPALERRRIL